MSPRWQVLARAIHTRTPNGGVVLDPVSKAYYTLNPAGEALWSALATGASAEELVRALCLEFEIDEATAATDVARWVEELAALGLIEPSPIG
jgi:PqqD family protein of HPr-rel-A system